MNTDHSNLNIVCITSALHPTYMYTMLSKNIYIYIFLSIIIIIIIIIIIFIYYYF